MYICILVYITCIYYYHVAFETVSSLHTYVTEVTVLQDRMHGTACHRTYDKT